MTDTQIRFDDGAAYERMMGIWSGIAGAVFIDWLRAPQGWRWIDVGCGNGAFSEQLVERCAPAAVLGVDPSQGQIDFARQRPAARLAKFEIGNAMALPFADNSYDAATMALVIFFVPEPAKGVAEMARVVRPGGTVAAYAWDVLGGGFPQEPLRAELRTIGVESLNPPSVEASRIEVMRDLWRGAGLEAVETREITVQRSFADFEDFWETTLLGASVAPTIAALSPADRVRVKQQVRTRVPADATGQVTLSGRANAVKGRVPG
ncbi:MAG TPA: methyltransferase domain-containing protein [Xanthobacteraceae bacterium]|jgi:SAM-dependent methyltransferase|nr:methyltransferase domain-containing protein [Xanthobacteraceae bacterium]